MANISDFTRTISMPAPLLRPVVLLRDSWREVIVGDPPAGDVSFRVAVPSNGQTHTKSLICELQRPLSATAFLALLWGDSELRIRLLCNGNCENARFVCNATITVECYNSIIGDEMPVCTATIDNVYETRSREFAATIGMNSVCARWRDVNAVVERIRLSLRGAVGLFDASPNNCSGEFEAMLTLGRQGAQIIPAHLLR